MPLGSPQSRRWVADHAPLAPAAAMLAPGDDPPPYWAPWNGRAGVYNYELDGSWIIYPGAQYGISMDDAVIINYALSQGPTVRLPATLNYGSPFNVSSPIVFPAANGTALTGLQGAMQGGAGSPGTATVIRPTSSWAQGGAPVPAVIIGGAAVRQDITDLWIDGSNLSTADVQGINYSTSHGGHRVARVGINNMPGWGLFASGFLGWDADTMIIQGCGGNVSSLNLDNGFAGGYDVGVTDSFHINVHAQTNTGYGIDIHGGDHRLVACRADSSTQQGFRLASFNGGTTLGIGVSMSQCATENNGFEGCFMTAGGTIYNGPYSLNGCQFANDGTSGTAAAMRADGRVVVSITDCNVSGTPNPAYGLATSASAGGGKPDLVLIDGGVWQVNTAFINDVAPATKLVKTGNTQGVIGAINGTSGTTAFVAV